MGSVKWKEMLAAGGGGGVDLRKIDAVHIIIIVYSVRRHE